MMIRGAVLETLSAPRPYSLSRPVRIVELDLEGPGAGELLVRIEAAGLCHSDLSVVNGSRPRPLPMLLGHEAAGIVEEVGSGVDDVSVGERVTMTFLPRCGECEACATDGRVPCTVGSAANTAGTLFGGSVRLSRDGEKVWHHTGVSGFATHAVVSRRSVVPVGADVPAPVAALLGCAVLTGGGAVLNVAQPQPGDSVMVVGLGGVGMAALLVAASIDGVRVIGVDVARDKLAIALELGADEVYETAEVAERGITATHVIEAAGHPRALELAFEATALGGRTVTVGLPDASARISLSPLTITAQARNLHGSYLGSTVPARDIPRYADAWRAGRLPVEKLISKSVPIERLNEALDDLSDGLVLRQIIEVG